jgi:TRAP-type C4-dicarboxylate transport system substrate-binding protein
MKRSFFAKMISLADLLLLIFCFSFHIPQAQGASKPEFTLRIAGTMPIGHFMTRQKERYAQILDEKTGGRLKIEVYPAGQLFSDKDMTRALPAGSVEMGACNLALLEGLVPVLGIMGLPYFFESREHIRKVEHSPKFMQLINEELEKKNMRLIFWMDYGLMSFISKKLLHKLEDFKGKRIRVLGDITTQLIQAFGGAPVFMGTGETYMALQRGTIDGVLTSLPSVYERKLFEVAKQMTFCEIQDILVTPAVLINLKIWKGLPPEIQKAMYDVGQNVEEWGFKESLKETDECLSELKKRGVEVYYLPDSEKKRWKEAANKPILSYYLKQVGEPGKKAVEEVDRLR